MSDHNFVPNNHTVWVIKLFVHSLSFSKHSIRMNSSRISLRFLKRASRPKLCWKSHDIFPSNVSVLCCSARSTTWSALVRLASSSRNVFALLRCACQYNCLSTTVILYSSHVQVSQPTKRKALKGSLRCCRKYQVYSKELKWAVILR